MEKMTYLSAKTKENIKKIDKQEQELTSRISSKKTSVKKALNDIKKTKVDKKEINKIRAIFLFVTTVCRKKKATRNEENV